MKCCNYALLDLIRKGLVAEGGGNETIELYAREIEAILEDEDLELYGEDDLTVDGPEPGAEQTQEIKPPVTAAEPVTKGTEARSSAPAKSIAAEKKQKYREPTVMTPEQIIAGRGKILHLIHQRMPADVPTLIRCCNDNAISLQDLATLTGIGYSSLSNCRTGSVTAPVAERISELFAFPHKTQPQEA